VLLSWQLADPAIAALTKHKNLVLRTFNRKHFEPLDIASRDPSIG